MRDTLAVLAIVFWVCGLGTCTLASAATGSITGSIFILTGTVCFVGLCIVNTLNNFRQKPPQTPPR